MNDMKSGWRLSRPERYNGKLPSCCMVCFRAFDPTTFVVAHNVDVLAVPHVICHLCLIEDRVIGLARAAWCNVCAPRMSIDPEAQIVTWHRAFAAFCYTCGAVKFRSPEMPSKFYTLLLHGGSFECTAQHVPAAADTSPSSASQARPSRDCREAPDRCSCGHRTWSHGKEGCSLCGCRTEGPARPVPEDIAESTDRPAVDLMVVKKRVIHEKDQPSATSKAAEFRFRPYREIVVVGLDDQTEPP